MLCSTAISSGGIYPELKVKMVKSLSVRDKSSLGQSSKTKRAINIAPSPPVVGSSGTESGTVSMALSVRLIDKINQTKIPHQVLNVQEPLWPAVMYFINNHGEDPTIVEGRAFPLLPRDVCTAVPPFVPRPRRSWS